MKSSYGKASVIIASLLIPVGFLAGQLVAWRLKSTNPSNVDITADLAYLRPILVSSFSVVIVLSVLVVILAVLGFKKDSNPQLAKTSLITLAAVVIVSAIGLLVQNRVTKVENAYSEKQFNTFLKSVGN